LDKNSPILLNPADQDYTLPFNVLEHVDPGQRSLVTSGLISVLKKIWPEFWGPRTEHILRYTVLALLEIQGVTLFDVQRMLVDEDFQEWVIRQVRDDQVKQFWIKEYKSYSKYFRTEAIAPIQNKIGAFLASPMIRNIVAYPKSSLDLRQIMDEGKVFLVNLSKGKIGEDVSSLLGSMLLTKIQLTTLSRQDIREKKRRDFYLYVDEFQSFVTTSFADLLTEARKYRLNLILAHQYLSQIEESIQAAVLGNCGTIISFRLGAQNAEDLSKEFYPAITLTDLVSLPKYHIYLRLMIDGVASDPFSAVTLPPPKSNQNKGTKASLTTLPRVPLQTRRSASVSAPLSIPLNAGNESKRQGRLPL
jgi:hypothetical protein